MANDGVDEMKRRETMQGRSRAVWKTEGHPESVTTEDAWDKVTQGLIMH